MPGPATSDSEQSRTIHAKYEISHFLKYGGISHAQRAGPGSFVRAAMGADVQHVTQHHLHAVQRQWLHGPQYLRGLGSGGFRLVEREARVDACATDGLRGATRVASRVGEER